MTTPVTMTAALVYHGKDEKRGEEVPILVGGEEKNYLDHLPDELLLLILNKILDARSLCRCTSLSKRFSSLVPQVDSVSVLATVPNISTTLCPTTAKKKPSSKWTRYLLKKLVHNFITKPLEFFQPFSIELVRPETSRSSSSSSSSNAKIGPAELTKWISNSLKNFFAVQSLRLELPAGGGVVGFPDNVPLLRWTAEFGTELESCAIIAATSVEEKEDKDKDEEEEEKEDEKKSSPPLPSPEQGNQDTDNNTTPNNAPNSDPNQPLLSDADLKSRVVWILSCLIAAGARHGLVRQMVLDCPNLRSAEIVDSGKQGKLSMNEEQIKALRDSISPKDDEKTTDGDAAAASASASDPIWKRSAIPNLILKLWYVPELELNGSGRIMKGATVVIVKPDERRRGGAAAAAAAAECAGLVEKENQEAAEASFGRGFCEDQDEGIGEAAREIMRSKWKLMYKMEMNSF